ncbi:hypothetical protein BOTBODRAFT_51945 [Botryobasidium botryosum FD-172 SS1]|uniref:Uncharacterized protein n=1 Tax=Botryobasidium botryosum (strain FD-172 SS1) TaxID=930990 RepID=A0A067N635_BOTB1|nr:hypothetical protein BOTBODRAFT_51945 [Botryobasidium botryosum FD-172 SS1]
MDEDVAPTYERIIRALVPLPVVYLLINVYPVDGRIRDHWVTKALPLARKELPAFRALRSMCGVQVMAWKIVLDELGEACWIHVTDEENPELKYIYEWEWRNISIEEADLSQFD